MEKYTSRFSVRYELKDNGDNTQSLYAKSYQNSALICETDLGNISYIVASKKERDTLEQALNEIREYVNTRDTFVLNGDVMQLKDEITGQDILKIINKVLGSENNEQ